jgi:hypothetical protein
MSAPTRFSRQGRSTRFSPTDRLLVADNDQDLSSSRRPALQTFIGSVKYRFQPGFALAGFCLRSLRRVIHASID